jgi:hypothetical protein
MEKFIDYNNQKNPRGNNRQNLSIKCKNADKKVNADILIEILYIWLGKPMSKMRRFAKRNFRASKGNFFTFASLRL